MSEQLYVITSFRYLGAHCILAADEANAREKLIRNRDFICRRLMINRGNVDDVLILRDYINNRYCVVSHDEYRAIIDDHFEKLSSPEYVSKVLDLLISEYDIILAADCLLE